MNRFVRLRAVACTAIAFGLASTSASAAIITFDNLGLLAGLNPVGASPVDVGGGFTLAAAITGQFSDAEIIDPNTTNNSAEAGGRTGYEYLVGQNPGDMVVTTLRRSDGAAFDLTSFIYHGWNNNHASLLSVQGVLGNSSIVSQNFAITSQFSDPWQTANLTNVFRGLDHVTFVGSLGAQSGNVFALDNINAASAAVPEPISWSMMLIGFGGLGAVLRRRRSQTAHVVA